MLSGGTSGPRPLSSLSRAEVTVKTSCSIAVSASPSSAACRFLQFCAHGCPQAGQQPLDVGS